jgi:hypothetical protein
MTTPRTAEIASAFPHSPRSQRTSWEQYADGQIWALTYETTDALKKAQKALHQWVWQRRQTLTLKTQTTGLTLYCRIQSATHDEDN